MEEEVTVDDAVAKAFVCPLNSPVMKDPVMCADGYSYERANIEHWLKTSKLSPVTGKALAHKNLVPHHTLRAAIQDQQKLE